MSRKKKSPRSRAKYPALNTRFMPKVRREYFDFDYIDKLSEEEKAWLNKFVDEELGASFKNDSRDLNKTKQEKKRAYSNNNSRNRDLLAITKANGLLVSSGSVKSDDVIIQNPELTEDAMIAELDRKNKPESFEE